MYLHSYNLSRVYEVRSGFFGRRNLPLCSKHPLNLRLVSVVMQTYIECFIEGNVLKDQALAIAQIFKEALISKPLPLEARPISCVAKLPAGTSSLYKERCKCEYERNSVVQVRPKDSQPQSALHALWCILLAFLENDSLGTAKMLRKQCTDPVCIWSQYSFSL